MNESNETISQLAESDKLRFWSKVDKLGPDECWPWLAGKTKWEQGRFKLFGKTKIASRVSWVMHFGSIPDDLCVLHKCDNPPCVNPRHLFLGTQMDNMVDRDSKGRGPQGEQNGMAMLNKQTVATIRYIYATSKIMQKNLAKQFGISTTTICDILNNRTWRDTESASR